MKRICFVTNSFNIGGIERVIITLANELSERYEVDLLVLKNFGSLKDTVHANVNVIDLKNVKVRFLFPQLLKYLNNRKPYFIITSIYPISAQAVIALKFACVDTKLIVTHHALFDVEHSGNRFHNFLLKQVLKYVYNRASITLAVSHGVYEFLKEIGIHNLRIMYNPIDVEEKKQNAEIKTDDINIYKPYFLFLGRLTLVKNVEHIIRSFAELRKDKKYKDYNLLIIGSGPDEIKLKNLCLELGIDTNSFFIGNKTYPEFYIKNAELVLLASLSEAMPVTVMESFSLNIPVVSTPARGCLDIFEKLDYRYSTHSFYDVQEYSDLIKKVMHDKYLIPDLSKKIINNYGVDLIIDKWIELFNLLECSKKTMK